MCTNRIQRHKMLRNVYVLYLDPSGSFLYSFYSDRSLVLVVLTFHIPRHVDQTGF